MAKRLEMDLEVGTRYRMVSLDGRELLYEVVEGPAPDGRMEVYRVESGYLLDGRREARRSVEQWVLREIDRGGWPWPPQGEPVYAYGQAEPAAYLPTDEDLEAREQTARQVQLGRGFRWPDPLPRVEGGPFHILDDLDGGGREPL